eukprot:3122753-Alexandrium_andersonii.AAC.1
MYYKKQRWGLRYVAKTLAKYCSAPRSPCWQDLKCFARYCQATRSTMRDMKAMGNEWPNEIVGWPDG